MERLTERFSNGQAAVYGCGNNCKYDYKYCHNHYEDCPTINEIYEKLANYEDAEEQGLLLRLPCKIGDEAWAIRHYRGATYAQKGFVNEMYLTKEMKLQIVVKNIARGEIGKTVFLTQAEAEQALAEMKGE